MAVNIEIITPPAEPAPTCAYAQQCAARFRAEWADHPGLLTFMRPRCATLISPIVSDELIKDCQRLMGFEPQP